MNKDNTDRIKLRRTILQLYTSDDCHHYSPTGFKHIYRSVSGELWGDHEWAEVDDNINTLSKENCFEIKLKGDNKHTIIDITLNITPNA